MSDDPQKREAAKWLAKGIAALRAKKVKEARQFLLKARDLDSNNVDILLWLTRTTTVPATRKRILERVLAIDPDHVQAQRALARVNEQLAEEVGEESETVPPSEKPAMRPAPVPESEPESAEVIMPPSSVSVPDFVSDDVAEETFPDPFQEAPDVDVQPARPPSATVDLENLRQEVVAQVLSRADRMKAEVATAKPPSITTDLEALRKEVMAQLLSQAEAAEDVTEEHLEAGQLPPSLTRDLEALRREVIEKIMAFPDTAEEAAAPESQPAGGDLASLRGEVMDDVLTAAPVLPEDDEDLSIVSADLTSLRQEAAAALSDSAADTYESLEDLLPDTNELAPLSVVEDPELQASATHMQPDVEWPESLEGRRCLTCGTINIAPAGSRLVNTPCPLCGQKLLDQVLSASVLPDAYLPFKVKEAEAAIAIEDADSPAGGARRLFGGSKRIMSRPRAVYLPVWVFNGISEIVFGEQEAHSETYTLLPVHCLPQIDEQLLRLASNLEFDKAIRYRAKVGQKAYVLLSNVALSKALVDARLLMLSDARVKARNAIAPALRGTDLLTATAASEVRDLMYQLILLPVWVNDVREGGRTYLGMVNGYTGQGLIGEPVKHLRRR